MSARRSGTGRATGAGGADTFVPPAYPNAAVFVTQSSANGQFGCWFDRDYGADVRVIDPAESLIRGSTTKMYQLAVWDHASGLALSAGQSYKWRGGYHLSSNRAPVSAMIDSVISKGDGFLSVMTNGAFA